MEFLTLSTKKVLPSVGYTYIIFSITGKVYVGATDNLKRRLKEHNEGRKKAWTNGERWHYGEVVRFETYSEARGFEIKLKNDGRTKKRMILGSIRIRKLMRRHKFVLKNYELCQ